MNRRAKRHTVAVTVIFDRPCSQAHAVRAARDCLSETHYPSTRNADEPGVMTVKGVKAIRSAKPKHEESKP